MKNHAALRKAVLLALHSGTHGNVAMQIKTYEIAAVTGLDLETAVTIAGQLDAKKWATFSNEPGGGSLAITMQGIEEVERMEQPLLRRVMSEHPIFYTSVVSTIFAIVGALVVLIGGKLIDAWFKAHGW